MSLLIQSSDVESGVIYDGTWKFSAQVKGNYSVNYSYWESSSIPWIWNGVDHLLISISSQLTGFNYADYIIDLVGNTMNNYTTTTQVANAIQADVESAISDYLYDYSVSCSYNSTLNAYALVFTYHPLVDDSWIGSIKMKYSDVLSTASGVFDVVDDEVSMVLHKDDTYTFYLYNTHVLETSPKFLLLQIDENVNRTIVSCVNSKGSLVIATEDIPLLNQVIDIKDATRELNIGVYRTNIEIDPVPLNESTTSWYLVLNIL